MYLALPACLTLKPCLALRSNPRCLDPPSTYGSAGESRPWWRQVMSIPALGSGIFIQSWAPWVTQLAGAPEVALIFHWNLVYNCTSGQSLIGLFSSSTFSIASSFSVGRLYYINPFQFCLHITRDAFHKHDYYALPGQHRSLADHLLRFMRRKRRTGAASLHRCFHFLRAATDIVRFPS